MMRIDWHEAIQYIAAGMIIASMFYLVITKQVDAQTYWQLCTLLLGGLGVYKATMAVPPPAKKGDASEE